MLTLPDFKEKKVVFITPKDGLDKTIRFSNFNICFYEYDKLVAKLNVHSILAVMIVGDCTLTTYLINKLTEHGISIYFLNYSLKNQNHINSVAEGNYQLREKQYFLPPQSQLEISKNIVKNKITNQYDVLKKAKKEDLSEVMEKSFARIDKVENLQQLLAHEGYFSSKYFPLLFEDVDWHRRAPQTKEDPINTVLDVGYTILFNYIDSLLNLFGFDCYKGIYHQEFYKRKSLVCDLMEPIRPIIDYNIIKAINLKQFSLENDFDFSKGQFGFENYGIRKKYVGVFSEALVKEKSEIYNYLLSFYRWMLNPEKYPYKFIYF